MQLLCGNGVGVSLIEVKNLSVIYGSRIALSKVDLKIEPGEIVTVEQTLQPGESGRLAYRGTEWTAVNTSDQVMEQGQHVQISSVDSLTLKLDTVKDSIKGA